MLLVGETPDDRKAYIKSAIQVNRSLMKSLSGSSIKDSPEAEEYLTILRDEVKEGFQELIELERWRRKNHYEKDEPYNPMKGKSNGTTDKSEDL